ncbi:MAG TPA: HAMP domain-containing sensor histidine kinase [Rhizomicrobium sp.]|jgi:signal transduction histidine kinase|nr:HAMP domain-containing sensor histidine kinase [Rhizomicrobium sp.]
MFGRIRAGLSEGWKLAAHSLSGRLLLLTIFYVMLGQVLIFLPTVGRYYRELLGNHVVSAELAVMPFTLPESDKLPPSLRSEIIKRAGAEAVLLTLTDRRFYFQVNNEPRKIQATIDLNRTGIWTDMVEAVSCLLHRGDRTLHVVAPTRIPHARSLGIILDEGPIRRALGAYALRVLETGFFVSALAACLVFASLFFVFVRPMERITEAMVRFRDNPEDSSRIVSASSRRDEIGLAERELASMQRDLYGSLQQKTRLAALGAAVARIQHDLRNILASAKLASDRLADIDDPVVKNLSPRLVASLDRAVALATQTLRYGRAEEHAPSRRLLALRPLVEEVGEAAIETRPAAQRIDFVNAVAADIRIDADSEQLYRMVLNLLRNAVEALAGRGDARIEVSAARSGRMVTIEIADNGPGIPAALRSKLFQPFATAARAGGSGLGLAIARDLARLHGGEMVLIESGPEGTRFRIGIPDREGS